MSAACDRQEAYEAHRRAWRAEAAIWLATRELPGAPPKIERREEILDLVLQRREAA